MTAPHPSVEQGSARKRSASCASCCASPAVEGQHYCRLCRRIYDAKRYRRLLARIGAVRAARTASLAELVLLGARIKVQTCNVCGKPDGPFGVRLDRPGHQRSTCKPCAAEYQRRYHHD